MTKINSGLKFVGNLSIFRVASKSKLILVDSKNIVLNTGKLEAIRWLGNGSAYKVSKISVGNGNTNEEAADVTDTGLQNELKVIDIATTTIDESNNWVTFMASFNSGDSEFENATPAEINECGLILSDGNPANDIYFSKKNISGQPFEHSTGITLSFVWRIWAP